MKAVGFKTLLVALIAYPHLCVTAMLGCFHYDCFCPEQLIAVFPPTVRATFLLLVLPLHASVACLIAAQADLGLLQACEMARSAERRQSSAAGCRSPQGSATLDGRDRKWIRARGQTVGGDESGHGEQRAAPLSSP